MTAYLVHFATSSTSSTIYLAKTLNLRLKIKLEKLAKPSITFISGALPATEPHRISPR
jgi:hypothetical protein